MSRWVQEELAQLVVARHSQDMDEDRRLGHDPNLGRCCHDGECHKLAVALEAVVNR